MRDQTATGAVRVVHGGVVRRESDAVAQPHIAIEPGRYSAMLNTPTLTGHALALQYSWIRTDRSDQDLAINVGMAIVECQHAIEAEQTSKLTVVPVIDGRTSDHQSTVAMQQEAAY